MTAIAYSSAAGGPVSGILLLEHLSTSRNCAEPLSETSGDQTMLAPSGCPRGKVFGVKSKESIEKRGGKTEAEERRVKSREAAVDGGGQEVERGLQEEGCHGRTIVADGGSWRCVASKRDVTRTESAIKRKAESNGNEPMKWPFCPNNNCVEDVQTTRRMHQQRLHVHLWFTILLFSLCAKTASSQVRRVNQLRVNVPKLVSTRSSEMIFFAVSQGHFPQMENVAAFKPVSASPTRSTCGLPERAAYCQSASSHSELTTCYQAFCVQECPYRSTTPPHAPLLLSAHRYVGLLDAVELL